MEIGTERQKGEGERVRVRVREKEKDEEREIEGVKELHRCSAFPGTFILDSIWILIK